MKEMVAFQGEWSIDSVCSGERAGGTPEEREGGRQGDDVPTSSSPGTRQEKENREFGWKIKLFFSFPVIKWRSKR